MKDYNKGWITENNITNKINVPFWVLLGAVFIGNLLTAGVLILAGVL